MYLWPWRCFVQGGIPIWEWFHIQLNARCVALMNIEFCRIFKTTYLFIDWGSDLVTVSAAPSKIRTLWPVCLRERIRETERETKCLLETRRHRERGQCDQKKIAKWLQKFPEIFTRKMIDLDTFIKIAKESISFGQINCFQRL